MEDLKKKIEIHETVQITDTSEGEWDQCFRKMCKEHHERSNKL